MQLLFVMAVLLSWVWLMGPESRANMAPFDPNDPRFAPPNEVPAEPKDKAAPAKKENKNKDGKKTKNGK